MKNIVIFCILFLFSSQVFASKQRAIILAKKGKASILTPYKEGSKSLLFEGKTYSYKRAKVGAKLKPGFLIKCEPDCKLKVGFKNGDAITVGPGTVLEVPQIDNIKKDGSSIMNLFYGKMRALVSKNGPRNNLRVKTRSAVSGVRGTDFFSTYYESTGLHTSVVRGQVEVTPVKDGIEVPTEKVSVKTGEVAKVEAASPAKPTVRNLNKAELSDIAKNSDIAVDKDAIKKLPKSARKEIVKIERQSRKNALEEIKTESPELLKVAKQKGVPLKDLSALAVTELAEKAPEGELEWNPVEKPEDNPENSTEKTAAAATEEEAKKKEEEEKQKKLTEEQLKDEDPEYWNYFTFRIINTEFVYDDGNSNNRRDYSSDGLLIGWMPEIYGSGRFQLHGLISLRQINFIQFDGENDEDVSPVIGILGNWKFGGLAVGLGLINANYDNDGYLGPQFNIGYRANWGKLYEIGLSFVHLEIENDFSPEVEDFALYTNWRF